MWTKIDLLGSSSAASSVVPPAAPWRALRGQTAVQREAGHQIHNTAVDTRTPAVAAICAHQANPDEIITLHPGLPSLTAPQRMLTRTRLQPGHDPFRAGS